MEEENNNNKSKENNNNPANNNVPSQEEKQVRRERIEKRHRHTIGFGEFFRMRKDLQFHHKILFVTLVFIGLVLCWYGVWSLVGEIPVIKNPLVALIVGVLILWLTDRVNALA